MKFKIVPFSLICVFLSWPDELAVPPEPSSEFRKVTVYESLKLSPDQAAIAQRVEERLRDYEFSDEFILGVLVNVYAESKFNQHAIGEAGERGIFQLHPEGLGKGMRTADMLDIDTSVDRIVRAVMKNKRMMKLVASGGTAEDHVRVFCEEIERPRNKKEKAKQRVKLLAKIADEEKICDDSVQLQLCA